MEGRKEEDMLNLVLGQESVMAALLVRQILTGNECDSEEGSANAASDRVIAKTGCCSHRKSLVKPAAGHKRKTVYGPEGD